MPRLFDDTITNLVNITSHKKQGLNISSEYRFYMTKLNSRPVPAGRYLGPYFTFYGYKFENGLEFRNDSLGSNGLLKGNYWVFNLGLELGYQFVVWKRVTLDLVLVGPSLSYYGGTTMIRGELSGDEIKEIDADRVLLLFPSSDFRIPIMNIESYI